MNASPNIGPGLFDGLGDLLGGFALCGIPELLEHAAPHIPAGLIDSRARARLESLPDIPTANAIGAFECRLEAGATGVDFEVCIRAAGGGRAVLAGQLDELQRRIPANDVQWRRTLAFLREWADPTSPLFETIPVIWLEFDLDGDSDIVPSPFVVVTIDPERTTDAPLAPETLNALSTALALLSDGGLDPAASRTMKHCLDELPEGSRLMHIAIRPGQRVDILRCIFKLRRNDLSDYLRRLGWKGSTVGLEGMLERLCSSTVRHSVNFDIGATIGPRIGVEYFFPSQPSEDPSWQAVLDALVACEACTPERRSQLEGWPSSGARNADTLLRIDRALLIKAVYETGAPLRAKAYLPFGARLNLG